MNILLFLILFAVVFLSAIIVIATHVAMIPWIQDIKRKSYRVIVSILATVIIVGVMYIFGMVYGIFLLYVVIFCVVIDLALFIVKRIRRERMPVWLKGCSFKVILPVLLAVIVTMYGYFNSFSMTVKDYQVTLSTSMRNDDSLRIAFFSDTHLGTAIQLEQLEEAVDKVNQVKPDIICLVGDIYDESTSLQEMDNSFAILSKLTAPYGVYYVFGNHDNGSYRKKSSRYDRIKEGLDGAGIKVLEDETVLINDSFYLAGRKDRGMVSKDKRAELDTLLAGCIPDYPVILLDHQPVELVKAKEAGVALELSGHTHDGQLFPGNLLTLWLGFNEFNYGYYQNDNYQLIVSSGLGTWGAPIRTAGDSEIVVVDVENPK
ncbi:MAG TPA: metallophosphoesterase [Lachnospiraceae bacterium]|nr:metallophosphoesterase [Lachnospiraceae bacterium]